MKREEAIKRLKWFREYNEDDFCGGDRIQDKYGDWYYRITEEDFEAFDMAIKALEQELIKGHWIPTFGNVKCSVCGSVKDSREVGKATHYCDFCGAKMESEDEDVIPQEPFINKPCVSSEVCEHDKQKVLDKIRAEIKALSPEPTAYDVVDGNPIKDAVWEMLGDVLQILDKYKAESEVDNGNDD